MPIRTKPLPARPPRFGLQEVQALTAALEKNELWYWQTDSIVEATAKKAATKFGSPYAVATSSGTASLHVAIAAAGLNAGMEVVTSPITDAGTINAILYQNLIPVFADVNPDTAVPTAKTVDEAITENTGAVVIVHLTGCPVEIDQIAEVCARRGVVLIEDCAQGLGATFKGQHIGTFGDFGCYSLNDQKHITCGEGGFVLCKSEDNYYLCHNYADKYYDRFKKGVRLHALAPNYRMSELDGAMFSAQLDRLDGIIAKRQALGDYLNQQLSFIPGIIVKVPPAEATCSYFFYLFRIDEAAIKISRDEFLKAMAAEGITASGAYVPVPYYRSPYFLTKNFFPGGIWPAEMVSGRSYNYREISLAGAELAVKTGISLVLHEGFSEADIKDYIDVIKKVVDDNS